MSVFIDRERELNLLLERYTGKHAEFVLLYGRRRVGKSELIERFLQQKGVKGLKLLAMEEAKKTAAGCFQEITRSIFWRQLPAKI